MSHTYDVHQLKAWSSNFRNYSYLIVDKENRWGAMIDPAWDYNAVSSLLDKLEVELVAILLTHSHRDHTDLVDTLVERHNCNVYMGRREIEYYSYSCKNLHALRDMDTLTMGKTEIACIHTPGHTVGSMCYLLTDSLFTGDTVFIEGCGMCTANGGSPEEMYDSIQKLKSIIKPDIKIYPGHSYGNEPGMPLSFLLDYNIYFQLDDVKEFVNFRMRKNQKHLFDFC